MGEMQELQPQQELQPKKETNEIEIPEQALQEISQKYDITDPKDIRWILDLEQKQSSAVISKHNSVIRNDAIRLSGHHDALGNPCPRDPGFPNFSVSKETNPENGDVIYEGAIGQVPPNIDPEDVRMLYEMYTDIRRICGENEPIEPTELKPDPLKNLPGYQPKI